MAGLGPQLQGLYQAGSTSSSSPSARGPTRWRCGCGSEAWGRPWPAGPGALRGRRRRPQLGAGGRGVTVHNPGGTLAGGARVRPASRLSRSRAEGGRRGGRTSAAPRGRPGCEPHRVGVHRHPDLPDGPGADRPRGGDLSPRPRLTATEAGLDELALLVDTAGADVVARIVQRRDRPDPATYVGKGRRRSCWRCAWRSTPTPWSSTTSSRPAQQRNLEKILGPDGHRPHRRDPRHLRPERPHPRRQGPGGAGPAALPPAPAAGPGAVPQPAGRWHRHPGPGGDPARGRPAAPGPPHGPARGGPAPARPHPPDPAPGPGAVAAAHGVPGGLHQRRQVHPAQPAVRRRRAGRGPAVLHPRPPDPAAGPARRRDGAADRHRRVRAQAAPPGGRGVPLDPRGGGRVRPHRPRGRRVGPDSEGQIDAVRTVLAEIGADGLPELLVVNKADALGRRRPRPARSRPAAGRPRGSVHSRPGPERGSRSC